MSKYIKIDYCTQCTFFHELERRQHVLKGYCENPENKNINGVKTTIINPTCEELQNRIYPFLESKYIPKWCRLVNYTG